MLERNVPFVGIRLASGGCIFRRFLAGTTALVMAGGALAQVRTDFTIDQASRLRTMSLSASSLGNSTNFNTITTGTFVYNFVSESITPSVSGQFSLGQTQSPQDTVLIVYRNSFDPLAPSTNFVANNDDGGALVPANAECGGSRFLCPAVQINLDANTTYELVLSTFSPGTVLGLPQVFFVDGSVSVRVGAAAPQAPVAPAIIDQAAAPQAPVAPAIIDQSAPSFDQASAAATANTVTFRGGTFRPTAAATLAQPVEVEGTGGRIDANGQTVTLSGNLTGAATMSVSGGGLVVVNTTVRNTGGITVDADGNLRVSGSVAAPLVVSAGGQAGGTGTLAGATTVSGTLSPGNSPGTLTASAAVTLNDGATLLIEVDGPGTGNGAGNHDRLVLNGATSTFTAAGTLDVRLRGITAPANNDFVPMLGQAFQIVTAEGGVVGSFARLAQPSDGLPAGNRFDALYGTNAITLILTPASYGNLRQAGLAQTENQRSVGLGLDAIRPAAGVRDTNAERAALFGALAPLGDGDIQPALDSLGGELHGDMLMAGLAGRRLFSNLLSAHLVDRRHGAAGNGHAGRSTADLDADGFAADRSDLGPRVGGEAADGMSGGDVLAGAGPFWAQIGGAGGQVSGDGNAHGYRHRSTGLMLGVDAPVAESVFAGIAVGTGETRVHAADGLGSGKVKGEQVAAYIQGSHGPTYALGSIGYAWSRYRTDRNVAVGTLAREVSGKSDGNDLSVALEVGHRPPVTGVDLDLFGGGRADRIRRDGFEEDAADGLQLSVEAESVSSVQSILGFRASRRFDSETGSSIRPELRMGWQREFDDRNATTDATLFGGTQTTHTSEVGRDALRAGLGVSGEIADGASLFADAEAVLRKREQAGQLSFGLRINW